VKQRDARRLACDTGPFVGFVNGILVLLSAFVDNAAYPILAISYLTNSGLLSDHFVDGPNAGDSHRSAAPIPTQHSCTSYSL
jgi:hypothetical protein